MKRVIINTLFIVTACSALLFWQGCKDPDEPADFDRTAMLTDIADKVIIPYYDTLVVECAELKTATNAFTAAPDLNKLQTLQTKWQQAKLAYKHCETFNLGTVKEGLLPTAMEKWPVNTAFIENFIATEDTIDVEFIISIGATAKGLAAIEYMIFDSAGNAAVLAKVTTNSLATARKAYLNAIAHNATLVANEMKNLWTTGAYPYRQEFIGNTATSLYGSVNLVASEMVARLEKVRQKNIGIALGATTTNGPDPSQVEAVYNDISLVLLKENLVSVQHTFNGSITGEGIGYDDYLDHLGAQYNGQPLSTKINSQFDLVYQKIDAINVPLSQAVVSQQPAVQEVYDALRDLIVLVKTDMASSLSLIITLSDNDGD